MDIRSADDHEFRMLGIPNHTGHECMDGAQSCVHHHCNDELVDALTLDAISLILNA